MGQGAGDMVGFRVGTGDTLGTGWGLGSGFFISSVNNISVVHSHPPSHYIRKHAG